MADIKAVVIHSGGMDSSLCLYLAMKEFSRSEVVSLSFRYGQRHSSELQKAAFICKSWGIAHHIIDIPYSSLTSNALIDSSIPIEHQVGLEPNTLVVGRNGLMARLGAIFANSYKAKCIYMGVMESEGGNSGYRDCSREYFDLKQKILQMDLDNPSFEIRTPLVYLDKFQSYCLAQQEGILEFLLNNTISCYEGVEVKGCQQCPACKLRSDGIKKFIDHSPSFFHLSKLL